MSIDIKDVVFITNHHRKSLFFEDTVRKILALGGRWVIQNTCGPNGFGGLADDIRTNPLVRYVNIGSSSYDAGMSRFKSSGIVPADASIICLMDNDLFLTGTTELLSYLQEFADGGYDFVCHTVGVDHNAGKYDGKQIAPLDKLTFSEPGAGNMPIDIRTPTPHFENAYLLYSKRAWDGMTPHDLSHHRRVLMKMGALGAKIGTHRVDQFEWSYTQWGKEWFHCGNLFTYFYHLESGDLSKWKPDSSFDLFRAGFFNAEERFSKQWLGKHAFSEQILRNLHVLNSHMGGQDKVLDVWDKLHEKAWFRF